MDFGWTSYCGWFWIFPVLCLLFMAAMMFIGRRVPFCGPRHGDPTGYHRETAREILERRYASGEISKQQYDAMRGDLRAGV